MRVATSAEASYGSSRLDSSRLCDGGVMGIGAGGVMGVGAGGVGVVIVAGVGGMDVGLGVEATSTIASTFTSGLAGILETPPETPETPPNLGNRKKKQPTESRPAPPAPSSSAGRLGRFAPRPLAPPRPAGGTASRSAGWRPS